GKDPPGVAVVESDIDPNRIRPSAVRPDKRFLELRFPAAGHDDLSASGNEGVGGRQHEVDALLMNEAGDEAKKWSARQRNTKLLPYAIDVRALRRPVACAERSR